MAKSKKKMTKAALRAAQKRAEAKLVKYKSEADQKKLLNAALRGK